ncbi:hypothetical protein L21TH_2023 [Caldisalinibacter kiritimatiensis]|uniref:Transposase IS200-like domain-containing protein n=2 Tax=Caldisalinibacter kiritimatiensis TaxID=1304284 RepID=R1ATI2_9FIRM|nr:hypothetical protein L21TH_2023 [Caldisalinibacter kiritimatiensis]
MLLSRDAHVPRLRIRGDTITPTWKNLQKPNIAYFITSTITNYAPILIEDKYKDILLDSLYYYNKKYSYDLVAYVIMPEHIHFILKGNNEEKLHQYMREFKTYTSKQILKELIKENKNNILNVFASKANGKAKYAVWMQRYRSIPVYNEKVLKQKIDYIHRNPLRRGLVDDVRSYKYSSFNLYYK